MIRLGYDNDDDDDDALANSNVAVLFAMNSSRLQDTPTWRTQVWAGQWNLSKITHGTRVELKTAAMRFFLSHLPWRPVVS